MLKEYADKRNFLVSPEPAAAGKLPGSRTLIFVVQKHAARRLHYDLRLELDGVLKSWAVPAGPSLNPDVKRLAVMVEDHPYDYANFEGIIPQGQYGAGQVIVWDIGEYSPEEEGFVYFNDREKAQELMRQGLEKGKLSFILRGQKLNGSFSLVNMKYTDHKNWLLFKHKDEFADTTREVLENGKSVLSGVEVKEIQASPPPRKQPLLASAKLAPFPRIILPMHGKVIPQPFSNPDWYFEPKLDGYRTIAQINNGQVHLISRNGMNVTDKYVVIAERIKQLPVSQAVFDGELIALDGQGKVCFQCLQGFLEKNGAVDPKFKAAALIYYVFDLLYLDGYSLLDTPLMERKDLLKKIVSSSGDVRFLDHFEGDGETIFRGATESGLEGIIAKRKASVYRPGERTADWLKIKTTLTDEFIVVGYTRGTGSRASTFGSLMLGYYDDNNRLISSGHVGTGFDEALLEYFKKRLGSLATDKPPFADKPDVNAPVTWVRPEVVVEVKFSEITRDGKLRAPVFLRVRDDKSPQQVRRKTMLAAQLKEETAKTTGEPDMFVSDVLRQLESPKEKFTLEVGRNRLEVNNLSKELWPGLEGQPGTTKRDLLEYLARVSIVFLKHLKDRPLSLSRYPDGVNGEHFYQKHWNYPIPKFVETVPLSEESKKHREYMMCNNLPSLLWLGQIADLEFHTWFSRINPFPDITVPGRIKDGTARIDYLSRYSDFIIFDIDPYVYSGTEAPGGEPELSRKGFALTCQVARWLKETLDALSLMSFVKTSGKTGLHVYVPIIRQFDFLAVRSAARAVSTYLERLHPKEITTDWAIEKRAGKIFLDYNQNVRGKTLASVYSPRPAAQPSVSTPLSWDELDKVYPADFTIKNVPDRLAKTGDLWDKILESKHDLKELLKLT